MNLQGTQYYSQDSDLLVYSSCQMCSLYWHVWIDRQQILLNFSPLKTRKKTFERFMEIKCKECEFKHNFYTWDQVNSTKDNRSRGMKSIKINVRGVYILSSIVFGYTPLNKLCGFLNMSLSLTKNADEGISCSIKVSS